VTSDLQQKLTRKKIAFRSLQAIVQSGVERERRRPPAVRHRRARQTDHRVAGAPPSPNSTDAKCCFPTIIAIIVYITTPHTKKSSRGAQRNLSGDSFRVFLMFVSRQQIAEYARAQEISGDAYAHGHSN